MKPAVVEAEPLEPAGLLAFAEAEYRRQIRVRAEAARAAARPTERVTLADHLRQVDPGPHVAGPQAYSLPACCTLIEDPREPGQPLCEDLGVMGPILERREINPRLHRTVDQQDPPDDLSGGTFRASWLPVVGAGREDLGNPVAAIEAMAASGEIPRPTRWVRGHDFAAGGTDAVASIGLAVLEPGFDLRYVWFDPTRDHPAVAAVESVALGNASRQGLGPSVPRRVESGRRRHR